MEMSKKVRKLESYLGVKITQEEVSLESGKSFNELVSYGLCLRFYGKDDELRTALAYADGLIRLSLKKPADPELIAPLYYLTGCIYYLLGDFSQAAGRFIKVLSYIKKDITPWFDLLFCLRSMGEFGLFEKAVFNFDTLVRLWQKSRQQELTQQRLIELIEKAAK